MSSDVQAKCTNSSSAAVAPAEASRSRTKYSTALTSWFVSRSISLTRATPAWAWKCMPGACRKPQCSSDEQCAQDQECLERLLRQRPARPRWAPLPLEERVLRLRSGDLDQRRRPPRWATMPPAQAERPPREPGGARGLRGHARNPDVALSDQQSPGGEGLPAAEWSSSHPAHPGPARQARRRRRRRGPDRRAIGGSTPNGSDDERPRAAPPGGGGAGWRVWVVGRLLALGCVTSGQGEMMQKDIAIVQQRLETLEQRGPRPRSR